MILGSAGCGAPKTPETPEELEHIIREFFEQAYGSVAAGSVDTALEELEELAENDENKALFEKVQANYLQAAEQKREESLAEAANAPTKIPLNALVPLAFNGERGNSRFLREEDWATIKTQEKPFSLDLSYSGVVDDDLTRLPSATPFAPSI